MTEPPDPVTLAASLGRILDQLNIRYVVGGSVASGILGEPRSTLDLDLMAELTVESAKQLATALGNDYYVDEASVLEAVRRTSSFNIIHYPTAMKVDVFVCEDASFARAQLDRSIRIEVEPGTFVRFYSPEDLIVRKLMWYCAGEGISDRQWRDVVGLIKANHRIDLNYLHAAAGERGVEDLLRRALDEAGAVNNS